MTPKIPYRSQVPSFLRSIFCPQKQENPEHKLTLLAVKDRMISDVVFRVRFLSFMRYVQGAYSAMNREKLLRYARNILQLKEADFKNLVSFAQHRNKLHWFYTTSVSDFLSDAGYGFFAKYRCFTAVERKIFEKTAKFEEPPPTLVRPTWPTSLPAVLANHITSFLSTLERARLTQTCSSIHYDLLRNSEMTLNGDRDIALVLKNHLGSGRTFDLVITSLTIHYSRTPRSFSQLQSCVRAFPNLEHLNMQLNSYHRSEFDVFRAVEPICNHLKRFEYGGYDLKGAISSLPQLEVWITPHIQGQENILQQLTFKCPKLTEIQLGEYSGDESILVNFIKAHASQLKIFKIQTLQATPAILEALGLCAQLQEIELRCYDGPESVLVKLIKTHSGQLHVFDMPQVTVTADILGALLSCTQLAEIRLNLEDNKAIMALVTRLPSLRVLKNSDSNLKGLKLSAQDDLKALAKSPVKSIPGLFFDKTCLKEDIARYIKDTGLENLYFLRMGMTVNYYKGDLRFSVFRCEISLRDRSGITKHWQDTVGILCSLLQKYAGNLQKLVVDFGEWYPIYTPHEQRRAFSHWLLKIVAKEKQLVELLLPPLDADQEILKSSLGKLTNLRVLRPACVLSVSTIYSFYKLKKLQRLEGVGFSDPELIRALQDLQKAIPGLQLD